MDSNGSNDQLASVRKRLLAGETVEPVRVKTFLSWFDQERRGFWVNQRITSSLRAAHLKTVPNFEEVHSNTPVTFELENKPDPAGAEPANGPIEVSGYAPAVVMSAPVLQPVISGAAPDPAFRIRRLESANRKPLSVPPDCSLSEVVTLMLSHDYSQLPVMTNERDVKGMVSWESIGARLALRKVLQAARDCMVPHYEVPGHTSLFGVVSQIVDHSYVLVRADDRTISGIVTTSDLSLQFQQLSEPFLLLAEIENHIRTLIDGKFTRDEFSAVKDAAADPNRKIETVADLTFGEYIRLLEGPENWAKVGLNVDRAIFVRELDRVRRVRNEVVHLDPEGINEEDHVFLKKFLQFLHHLLNISR